MFFIRMKRQWGLLLLLAYFIVPYNAYAADKYYAPQTHFNAAFQIMDLKFSNILGMFKNATGSFAFDEGTKNISNLRLALDTGSLTTSNGMNVEDLAALFEAEKFPEITFASMAGAEIGDSKKDIKGTLTVHGVSKPFTFEATLNHVGAMPGASTGAGEGKAVGISLRGNFKRADFGIGDAPEVHGRFGESVSLMLEIQAIGQ